MPRGVDLYSRRRHMQKAARVSVYCILNNVPMHNFCQNIYII